MNIYDLQARHDSRQSFYGKAQVITEGKKITLRSYSMEVAYIENGKAHVEGTYSTTTLRHIKEFLRQNCFKATNKKQIENDYKED